MLFKVQSLEELAKLIVASKSTDIMQFFGGIFVAGAEEEKNYFTFGDPEEVNEFMNIYYAQGKEVEGKFLRFPVYGGEKKVIPSQGIEGTDIFIPLIHLEEHTDHRKFPKASPLVLKMKSFEDLLRSALGWPGVRSAFIMYNWRQSRENVYTMKLVQRVFDKSRRIYFTFISDREITGSFIKYRVTNIEEWKVCENLVEPKWVYFPIIRLEEGFSELSNVLDSVK
ncbi:MAG: hypothetical protein ACUVQ8_06835 [Nitrososphaeria archaeon]